MAKRKRVKRKGTKRMGTRIRRNAGKGPVQESAAWSNADWQYTTLITSDMMPMLGAVTGAERIERLRDIIKGCPDYYPATIELGYRIIKEGDDREGLALIDRGIASVERHFGRDELVDIYEHVLEFLKKHYRFATAVEYCERFMEVAQDKADVYDWLCLFYSRQGDLDTAFEMAGRAVELDDGNPRLLCNLGWTQLLRGNLEEAGALLERSLELNGEDTVTQGNYEVLKAMRGDRRLRSLRAYLLRPVDHERLDRLLEDDDCNGYTLEVRQYNHDRLQAFEEEVLCDPGLTPTQRFDMMFTLRYVLDTIREMHESSTFFYHDAGTVELFLDDIMYRLIMTTRDMDDELFDEMTGALLAFYGFLARHRRTSEYGELKRKMARLRPMLLDKLHRYNAVRHRPGCTEEERMDAREELFESGDFLPFL